MTKNKKLQPKSDPPDKKINLTPKDTPYYTIQIPLKKVIRHEGLMQ
jgi:hypothetical protein